jgi:hypothetical protein
MISTRLFFILAIGVFGINGVWIESPKITNWGEWGQAEYCNASEFVYGFRLKVQQDQGILDDTALNAIELHCVKTITGPRTIIKSKEGIKGAWGTVKECAGTSYAVGFEMRTEPVQVIDNTAGNNMRLYCSDNNVLEGNGMSWGDWTGALFCPSNMKICGLRVQVEDPVANPPKGGTGVNNVDMWCCDRNNVRVKMSKTY